MLQELGLIILAVCGFGVAGILSSVAAQRWSNDVLGRVPSALPFADIFTRDIEAVRNDIAATAVSTVTVQHHVINFTSFEIRLQCHV